jgi:cytidyltransferase-like protein
MYIKSFSEFLHESYLYEIIGQQVAYFPGRFQPFHLGHLNAVKRTSEVFGVPVIPLQILSKKETSPFPESLLEKMGNELKKEYSFIADFFIYPTNIAPNFVSDIVKFIKSKNYEPIGLGCGADRIKDYTIQIDRAKKNAERYGVVIPDNFAAKMVDDRASGEYSGTAVRKALAENDIQKFNKLMPPVLHKYYNELKKYIK